MFTGIIEETGAVRHVSLHGNSGSIQIGAELVLKGTKPGDSIAVNGVCLTVTTMDSKSFTADVMAETLRRSNLGNLKGGDRVNLERAMPAEGRFGGHIVSGHIDGTGRIRSMERDDNAVWVTVDTPASILRYIIDKGSITIDGISLTVARVDSGSFAVSVIPHTMANTILLDKKPGDTVNLENDLVGKYVERLLTFSGEDQEEQKPSSGITMEFLMEHGF